MALKADPPDFLDSGGPQNVDGAWLMNKGVPLAIGTALAMVFITLGLGLASVAKDSLKQIPVVGKLLGSGESGNQVPSGWEGM